MENRLDYRYFFAVVTLLLIAGMQSCKRDNPFRNLFKDRPIELEQGITSMVRPTDSLFLHFDKNWKKLISQRVELIRPVFMIPEQQQPKQWNPLVTSDCVFSPGAGANVPKINISWVEDIRETGDAQIRVDIALLYKAYENNSYTTVYPPESQKRFIMPQNSALIADTAAVLIAGAALFPKLTHFSQHNLDQITAPSTPQLQDRQDQTKVYYKKYDLVLEELGQGLTYTIRVCRYNGENWTEEKRHIFSTPICTQKF